MVHYVYNYFVFEAKDEQSAINFKKEMVVLNKNNNQYISFDAVKKTPESLINIPSSYIRSSISELAYWASDVSNFHLRNKFYLSDKEIEGLGIRKSEIFDCPRALKRHILYDFNNKSEERQIFNKLIYNCENYGYPDFYYWRLANWGCRGNSLDDGKWYIKKNKLYLFFETAWQAPHLLFDNYQNGLIKKIKGYYHCPESDYLGCVEYNCIENIPKKFCYNLTYYPLEIDIDKIKKSFFNFKSKYFPKNRT